jgi:hypothetical protein
LKAIGIANAVKEQVNQNKENQRILAQATVEANDKIEQLEKQQVQLYAALMAKQPPPSPLQDTTAATITALTDRINRLESGGNGGTGRGRYRKSGGHGIMTTTVGHVGLISSTQVKHVNISKTP